MNKVGFLSLAKVMLSFRFKRYYEPLRLPFRAESFSLPYTTRLVVSPPPKWVSSTEQSILKKHAIPATPGVDDRHFRYFNDHPATFPFCPQGRLLQFVYEATYRFTCVTACFLAERKLTTPRYHNAASSCYRGVRTTTRTGLKPARLTTVTANGQTTLLCNKVSR